MLRVIVVGDDLAVQPSPGPAVPPRVSTILNAELLLDVVVPVVVYQLLVHGFGVARLPALVISGAFPGFNVVRRLVREHRLDPIGAIVLLGILVGAVLSYVSGSEKLTLLRDSFFTAAIGMVFLGSTVVGKPLMFLISRSFTAREDPERLAAWDRQWRDSAKFRRVMRQMTVMWGVAFVAEFGVKVAMVETLSTDVVQAMSGPLILSLTVVLVLVTFRWGRRAQAQADRAIKSPSRPDPQKAQQHPR